MSMSSWFSWNTRRDAGEGNAVVDLLEEERSTAGEQMAAVSTITFFEGKAPEQYLRERVAAIVAANPWLAGTFVKLEGRKKLVHPKVYGDQKQQQQQPSLFHVLDIKINMSTPLHEMREAAQDAFVKKMAVLAEGDPIFKVSLVRDHEAPQERFAIIFSLNHSVGDGHTFYTLYKMLCQKREITALEAQRKPKVVEAMVKRLGEEETAFAKSGALIVNLLMSMARKAFYGPRYEVGIFYLNEDWIAAEKKKWAAEIQKSEREKKTQEQQGGGGGAGAGFVSTNDIVTSWVMRFRAPQLGWMAINFRNKIADCTDADAGNYATVMMYREQDYASPLLIRKSLATFKRAAQPATPLPTAWQTIRGLNIHVMTNWATFYDDIHLDGCKQQLHLPFIDFSECLDTVEFGIIFRVNKDRLALLLCGPPGLNEQAKKANPGILLEEPFALKFQ